MWNFNDVIALEYRGGHTFYIAFDDGVAADVDLGKYVGRGPVFMPLKDPDFFRRAKIDGGTISWPNEADIAPETLYDLTRRAAGLPVVPCYHPRKSVIHFVVAVEYRDGHTFHIAFDDGVAADVDLGEYVGRGPVFMPLKDPDFFRRATTDGDTIVWPNGANIAPETLYEMTLRAAEAADANARAN